MECVKQKKKGKNLVTLDPGVNTEQQPKNGSWGEQQPNTGSWGELQPNTGSW